MEDLTTANSKAKIVEVLSPKLTEAATIFKTKAKITEALGVFKIDPKIIDRIFFCVGLSFFATFAYLRYLPHLFQIQQLWPSSLFALEFLFAQLTVMAGLVACVHHEKWASWSGLLFMLLVHLTIFKFSMDHMYGVLKSHPQELLPLSAQPEYIQHKVQTLETENHCCGVFDSRDWAKQVPKSCFCEENVSSCRVVNGQNVFSAPCEPHVAVFLEDFAAKAHHIFSVFVTDLVLGVSLIPFLVWKIIKHQECMDNL